MTGDGMPEFFEAVDRCRAEYDAEYKPFLTARKKVTTSQIHHCPCSNMEGSIIRLPVH